MPEGVAAKDLALKMLRSRAAPMAREPALKRRNYLEALKVLEASEVSYTALLSLAPVGHRLPRNQNAGEEFDDSDMF